MSTNIYINHKISAVNCTDPPVKSPGGTWEWGGEFSYETSIIYTCGPYGRFLSSEGTIYEKISASADGGPRSRVRARGTLRSAPHRH